MQLGKQFRKMIRDIVRWANDTDNAYDRDSMPTSGSMTKSLSSMGISIGSASSTTNSDREMNFTVTNANGGKIIKVQWYDHKVSREYVNLHIVVDGENLAEELAQIITRESLNR